MVEFMEEAISDARLCDGPGRSCKQSGEPWLRAETGLMKDENEVVGIGSRKELAE